MKKNLLITLLLSLAVFIGNARTLIVYYSYTNNVERIVNELKGQIEADVIEIQPAEKGLDYAANNYAIGSAQIAAIRNNPSNAASYPAIDPVSVNLADYNTVIIGAPLWWSQMAAPLQTFLFQHGAEMAGKNIGLIVSSASSGISGVESAAKRLVPGGKFFSPSLWIRSSQTSNARSLLQNWLKTINYESIAAVSDITADADSETGYTVFNLAGSRVLTDAESIMNLNPGLYIINGKKIYLNR